jgi:hypothetical protein
MCQLGCGCQACWTRQARLLWPGRNSLQQVPRRLVVGPAAAAIAGAHLAEHALKEGGSLGHGVCAADYAAGHAAVGGVARSLHNDGARAVLQDPLTCIAAHAIGCVVAAGSHDQPPQGIAPICGSTPMCCTPNTANCRSLPGCRKIKSGFSEPCAHSRCDNRLLEVCARNTARAVATRCTLHDRRWTSILKGRWSAAITQARTKFVSSTTRWVGSTA